MTGSGNTLTYVLYERSVQIMTKGFFNNKVAARRIDTDVNSRIRRSAR